MKLTLFGASGFVGQTLTNTALQRGHHVKVLARNPEKLGDLLDKVDCIQGDYFRKEDIARALQGSEAVLSAIGPPLGRKAPSVSGKHQAAMTFLLDGMNAAGLSRIVAIAGAGCIFPGEKASFSRRMMRRVLFLIGGKNYAEKEAEHFLLSSSDLEWVIVRPPMIATDVSGQMHADAVRLYSSKVDVQQLADFMLDSVAEGDWIRQAPLVSTR